MRFGAATAALAVAVGIGVRAVPAIATSRVAVVVGSDAGERTDARLRYAQSDARQVADILLAVGDVAPVDLFLVEGGTADAVRAAIATAEARLLRSGDGLLIVYYSGHADGEALHLGGTLLPLRDIQAMLRGSAVATRLLIIDACRSGALTYVKGGTPGGRFEISGMAEPAPRGMAIVASSSAGEDAQESEELHASFFTHHLVTGLLGAADANRDGSVTLGEAFAYSAQHTAASTATTWAGPQHPTYKLDLGGREDLVLTRPGGSSGTLGHLTLGEPGNYVVRREGQPGLVAEISSDAVDRPLALRAGRYEVTRRGSDHLLTGTFQIAAATSTRVTASQMRRVEFGRAVRKGGTPATLAMALYATGAYRGPMLGLGGSTGAGVGARMDFRQLSASLALDLGTGSVEGTRATRLDTSELGLRAGLYHASDVSRLTVMLGVEIGASRFGQTASDQPLSVHSYAASGGPALIVEAPVTRRFFASLQAALPAYVLSVESIDRTTETHAVRLTYRVAAGVGAFL